MKNIQRHYYAHCPYPIVPEAERPFDWRYQLMDLPEGDLLDKVQSMTRLELVGWLAWNDVHGIFLDEDAINDGYPILTKEHAATCVFAVVMRNRKGWNGYMGEIDLRDLDLAVSLEV